MGDAAHVPEKTALRPHASTDQCSEFPGIELPPAKSLSNPFRIRPDNIGVLLLTIFLDETLGDLERHQSDLVGFLEGNLRDIRKQRRLRTIT